LELSSEIVIAFGQNRRRWLNPSSSPSRGGRICMLLLFDPIFYMSANDDTGSKRKRLRLDDDTANFVYTGQANVPEGVIHVRVHPSVRVIRAKAYLRQSQLINVDLHDGLEVIEEEAFSYCSSLREILFPPSVRAIKARAFWCCSGLMTAILNGGLEEIGKWAFSECALVRIDIPPSSRAIDNEAFDGCSGLTTAILNDGLEEIGEGAFAQCALVRIDIPPSVRAIKDCAFCHYHALTTVILNDWLEEIEEEAFCGGHWCASTYLPPSRRSRRGHSVIVRH
jgi:hypothetical protein